MEMTLREVIKDLQFLADRLSEEEMARTCVFISDGEESYPYSGASRFGDAIHIALKEHSLMEFFTDASRAGKV